MHGVNGRVRRETPWADSAASQAAERKSQYYSLLYKEIAERKRAEENLRQSNALLMALGEAQLRFVSGVGLGTVLHDLLVSLLAITGSSGGVIGEQIEAGDPPVTCEIHALVGTASYAATNEHVWASLVDRVLTTGKPARELLRPAGVTDASPRLLGFPISTGETVVGVLALADYEARFTLDMVAFLKPALSTCAQLILAHRNELRRQAAERELAEERALLAQRVADRTMELRMANAELTHAAHAKDQPRTAHPAQFNPFVC